MANPPAAGVAAKARSVLSTCLTTAVGKGASRHIIEDFTSVEGSFRVLKDTATQRTIAVLDAIPPSESPFDDVPRDRLRSVAVRLQAPYFILTNLRRVVSYRTDGVLKRLPMGEVWPLRNCVPALVEALLSANV